MSKEERRNAMLKRIQSSEKPLAGAKLAQEFSVSRQVVVQDIALLRAAGHDVISTSRGYLWKGFHQFSRAFRVCHRDDQIEDELNTIVDCGGVVQDVFVNHEVYGEIRADLGVACRQQAARFAEGIRSGRSQPLKNVTSGIHYHTVSAESERILEYVGEALRKKNYLAEDSAALSGENGNDTN